MHSANGDAPNTLPAVTFHQVLDKYELWQGLLENASAVCLCFRANSRSKSVEVEKQEHHEEDMESTLPVTLIVKAPNQQIEDQTIKCELSWTINKLKQHLQEVYPSKPPKHEQKLIYSGQLLNDSAMLKDVLRQYDGQETHTVHLVCSSSRMAQMKPQQSQQQPSQRTEEQQPNPQSSQSTSSGGSNTEEQRIPSPMNMQWANDGNFDPNRYAMHMAWMQQAYMQYLAQQYAALSAVNPPPTAAVPQNLQFPPQQNQAVPPREPQPAAQEAAAPPQPVRDPENPERDWLDHFYMLSRIMVLFSIVYFYSSPLRFVFVVLLGFGLYLYQIGFFRNINVNNNNNNINPTEQVVEENQAPSRLMVAWTFFTTFFASLIPEIPNAV